ncbi:hypothetical protein [Circoviridae sp.]|nr:hypothetical protein [Circoviridae sp.]
MAAEFFFGFFAIFGVTLEQLTLCCKDFFSTAQPFPILVPLHFCLRIHFLLLNPSEPSLEHF